MTCKDACVNPEDVYNMEITDGSMRSIKEEDGLIGGNYLDNIMQEIMDEFVLTITEMTATMITTMIKARVPK